MKELKLDVESDFSDCAIEDSIDLISKETNCAPFLLNLDLTISVFDAPSAVKMMLDYPVIRFVHITKEFHYGRYCLKDTLNNVIVIGGLNA